MIAVEPANSRRRTPRMASRMMNIGALAEQAGVAPKTIRYYEDIGLIRRVGRLPNGYRAYSAMEMRELRFIRRGRELGFSIEEIRDLLDLWRDKRRASRAVKALAASHLKALDRKIAELQAMRRSLAHLVANCRGDERPDCPILEELEGV
jgi:MerR family copper efflux transcriptional regulator